MVAGGCFFGGLPESGDGLTGTPTDQLLYGVIKNLQTDLRLSGDQPLTIIYDASASATSVSAFYVEVESASADPADDAPRVVFNQNLSTGENRSVTLQTGSVPRSTTVTFQRMHSPGRA